jgi:hypothetical protein
VWSARPNTDQIGTGYECSVERTGAMGNALFEEIVFEEGKAGFMILPGLWIKNRGHCSGFEDAKLPAQVLYLCLGPKNGCFA